jgi:hypothetical protein
MKTIRYSVVAFSIMLMAACGGEKKIDTDLVNNPISADGVDTETLPVITFEESEFDFGDITQGQEVRHIFKFKNTGKGDLLITDATGSCGCTVPTYPKKPIRPGESEQIEVVFNSAGKSGAQEKSVSIYANTQPNVTILKVKSNILVE